MNFQLIILDIKILWHKKLLNIMEFEFLNFPYIFIFIFNVFFDVIYIIVLIIEQKLNYIKHMFCYIKVLALSSQAIMFKF